MLPDGRLASGSEDKLIRLWDVTAGAETTCLEAHLDQVYVLCALPDGRLASEWSVSWYFDCTRSSAHES
jgi:WD40 repeat protein